MLAVRTLCTATSRLQSIFVESRSALTVALKQGSDDTTCRIDLFGRPAVGPSAVGLCGEARDRRCGVMPRTPGRQGYGRSPRSKDGRRS